MKSSFADLSAAIVKTFCVGGGLYKFQLNQSEEHLAQVTQNHKELRAMCPHPRDSIIVEADLYSCADGYGGRNYFDSGFIVSCTLCVSKIGKLGFNIATGEPEGDEDIVEIFNICEIVEADNRRRLHKDNVRRDDLAELDRLKQKYE